MLLVLQLLGTKLAAYHRGETSVILCAEGDTGRPLHVLVDRHTLHVCRVGSVLRRLEGKIQPFAKRKHGMVFNENIAE
jgi:hypothetical protein